MDEPQVCENDHLIIIEMNFKITFNLLIKICGCNVLKAELKSTNQRRANELRSSKCSMKRVTAITASSVLLLLFHSSTLLLLLPSFDSFRHKHTSFGKFCHRDARFHFSTDICSFFSWLLWVFFSGPVSTQKIFIMSEISKTAAAAESSCCVCRCLSELVDPENL